MEKIKKSLYDHRFALFFFAFLMAYSFFISGNAMAWRVDDVTYSFHVVDFSIGFCTKLLPGAICKLIFGEPTRNEVSAFLTVLIAVCYFILGFILEKLYKRESRENKTLLFIFILFFLTGPATFAVYVNMFCWLDFYWLLAAVLSVFCLQNKKTYILVLPLMLFAVMSHYASILCYVPFVAIFMLYKISLTENKKEKIYLSAIWWVFVVSAIALSLYMMLFETQNVKMPAEELKAYLNSLEIEDTRYYIFSLFRDKVEELMPEHYTEEFMKDIVKDIDMTGSPLKILGEILVQQISTNKAKGSTSGDLKHFIIISPAVAAVYKVFSIVFKKSKKDLLKRFSVFCAGVLFFFTLISGYFFSTDTIRWISHALVPFFSMFLYMIYKEKEECRNEIFSFFKKIPEEVIICYLGIFFVSASLF